MGERERERHLKRRLFISLNIRLRQHKRLHRIFLYTDCCTILFDWESKAMATCHRFLQSNHFYVCLDFVDCFFSYSKLTNNQNTTTQTKLFFLLKLLSYFAHHHILLLVKCSECRHQTSEKPTKRKKNNTKNQLCIHLTLEQKTFSWFFFYSAIKYQHHFFKLNCKMFKIMKWSLHWRQLNKLLKWFVTSF